MTYYCLDLDRQLNEIIYFTFKKNGFRYSLKSLIGYEG
jgi:hypothetical protein